MYNSIYWSESLLLAQNEGVGAFGPLIPLLLIGVVFYFLIIRPQSRERAKQEDMRSNLKKNDRVITIGGIYGVVVNTQSQSDEVTVRIDDNSNTKIRVMRSAISQILSDDAGKEANKEKN